MSIGDWIVRKASVLLVGYDLVEMVESAEAENQRLRRQLDYSLELSRSAIMHNRRYRAVLGYYASKGRKRAIQALEDE